MPQLTEVLEKLKDRFSVREVYELACRISIYNRIQGSPGLEEAAALIKSFLESLRPNIEVREYTFSYSSALGLHAPLVGWSLEECRVELVKPYQASIILSLDTALCAVAHSPPGEVEGEVVYVGDGSEPSAKGVAGAIVLSHGPPSLVYRLLADRGARGFLFFRQDLPETAVPYAALFLSPDEFEKYTAPAASIPLLWARKIIRMLERGEKVHVRIFLKAFRHKEPKIKVIEASLGEGSEEVHVCAHYCHPGSTVNDNVSGVVALLELAAAFNRSITEGALRTPKSRIAFVVFPEYYGSLPYLFEKHRAGARIIFSVNLDMVGERQEVTGSTLNLIVPPSIISDGFYEGILYAALLKSLSEGEMFNGAGRLLRYRLDVSPYEGGSDHDIYLQFSIPSVALIQWPDIFYHSNLDDVSKFDPIIVKRIAVAVGAAVYYVASKDYDEAHRSLIKRLFNSFIEAYRGFKLCKNGATISEAKPPRNDEVKYVFVGPKGALCMYDLIKRVPTKLHGSLIKFLNDEFRRFLLLKFVPTLLMIKPMSLAEISAILWSDYCLSAEKEVAEALRYLMASGLVDYFKEAQT